VRTGQFPTLYPDKYPDKPTWFLKQQERAISWGFNACGYASNYCLNNSHATIMNESPFTTSDWATRDDKPWNIKTLYHNFTGEVCGSSQYLPSGGGQEDIFEPGAAAAYNAIAPLITHGCNGPGGLCWDSKTAFIMPEEGDHVYGMNNHTHADLGLIVLLANPVQNVSANGGITYTDKMVYGKTAMRDFLANEYGCTGSADPAAGNYCGSGPAATALAALNTAWYGSSVYTTWNTSDAGGLTGIHNGTYASYGTGTGFLDENGTHALNSATKSSCQTTSDDTWGHDTALETDAHAYVTFFATTYAQEISFAFGQSSVLPQPPLLMILYDGPINVYTAMAPYFKGYWISPIHRATANDRLAMVQSIIAASSVHGGKSMPIIYADYATSTADCFPNCTGSGNSEWPSRNAMGVGMVTDWQNILSLQDSNSKYVVIGIEHWGWYDTVNAFLDGGLVSAFADNPYDGGASIATATHSTTWQSGHTYPAPSLIWDGTNYEARNFGATPANCTSGSGPAPTWATKMGAATTDNTCVWYNEGPYTLKPEQASRIPSTATLPGVAYGDEITPIATFLNAGICNPSSSLTITSTGCPNGTVGVPYICNMYATGGTVPYTWSFSAGNLNGCTGLSLATVSNVGVISGTPMVADTCSFTEEVMDAVAATATQPNSVTINAAAPTPTNLTGEVRMTGSVVIK
jgi:hypothetical protein